MFFYLFFVYVALCIQKLNSRLVTLVKTKSIAEDEKPKWKESLTLSLMSSEDSDDEGSFSVRPLPWRSQRATNFFHTLDGKYERKLSVKSKRMKYIRKEGLVSDRERPNTGSVPGWCLGN